MSIKKIYLNPFYILFNIYLLANCYSFVKGFLGEGLNVDNNYYQFSPDVLYYSGFALIISFFIFIFIFIFIYYVLNIRDNELNVSDRWSKNLFFLQILYFIYSYIYGVDIAGVESSGQEIFLFKIAFLILPSDIFYLIFAPGIKSNRWFFVNTLIYMVSSLLRGWMGGFLLIAVIFLIRSESLRVSFKKIIFVFIVGVFLIFTLPFFLEMKWIIRSNQEFIQVFNNVIDYGYGKYLLETFDYVVNRFQMFGHIALLSESSQILNNAYVANEFIPYWMDGIPQWIWLKVNGTDVYQLNKYMVSYFFNSDNPAYSTNPGLAGWFFVLQEKVLFLFVYLFFITIPPMIFIFKYAGRKYFMLLMCFSMIYLFHGWIGAYLNFMIYLVCFVFLKKCVLVRVCKK